MLLKINISVFPTKSETKFQERLYPLWTQEPQTFYALFVDAATCYPQYPYQSNVGLELHLFNDDGAGGHLSAEENGECVCDVCVCLFVRVGLFVSV